ncbi:MAG: Maf family protein [Spirochaetaceae bacterium]|jgi:septum formation protein|nr:Maf family protein [Spirochaetaceae bacterium]
MESIVLASGSLRRQEYFRLMGLPFNIMPSQIEEDHDERGDPETVAGDLAVRKVKKAIKTLENRLPLWICGADTIISIDGKIYGKPRDREDAGNMLKTLQGREHRVVTAVALYNGREKTIDCRPVTSGVTFAPLSEREIEWYLDTGEWQGAAGSYKMQGLASCFISNIRGSYSAIVGLPMREFYVMLVENGYPYGDATVS